MAKVYPLQQAIDQLVMDTVRWFADSRVVQCSDGTTYTREGAPPTLWDVQRRLTLAPREYRAALNRLASRGRIEIRVTGGSLCVVPVARESDGE